MSGKTSPAVPHGKVPAPARTAPGATPAPARTPASNEEAIRSRAYSLWEEAGHPDSDGVEFWLRAERELKKNP
jgi:hypothetical protein